MQLRIDQRRETGKIMGRSPAILFSSFSNSSFEYHCQQRGLLLGRSCERKVLVMKTSLTFLCCHFLAHYAHYSNYFPSSLNPKETPFLLLLSLKEKFPVSRVSKSFVILSIGTLLLDKTYFILDFFFSLLVRHRIRNFKSSFNFAFSILSKAEQSNNYLSYHIFSKLNCKWKTGGIFF